MTGMFRAYDIRGVYGQDLTVEQGVRVGKAFGTFLDGTGEVVVGRDSRISGPVLSNALASGLLSTGCDCVDVGLVPTPIIYFASIHYGKRAGVMLTASHNPPEYNGFKLCREGLSFSYDTAIGQVEKLVESGRFKEATWEEVGSYRSQEVSRDYMEFILGKIHVERKLKVVIDVGNGTCGFAGELFKKLGCDVEVLFPEPDGRFPHHIPNPLKEETLVELQRRVLESKADFGIAFDGDGDRVGFIDDRGQVVRSDAPFMLFARDVLRRHPNSKIITDVLSSKAVSEDIAAHGGVPLMMRVGHSYIQEGLFREGASFAGELSGHFYFGRDYYGYDDGVFAAVKMVEILSKTERTLSKVIEVLPRYVSSPEIRLKCADDRKVGVVEALKRKFQGEGYRIIDIDGVRVEFDDGWGLVRASNTEPALVLRFEASSKDRVDYIQRLILGETEKALSSMF